MVIIMNENTRKNSETKAKQKDRYTIVLASQIIALIIMMLTFNLFVRSNDKAYADFKSLLNRELFTVGDIIETVKDYFSLADIWAVSGSNVTMVSGTSSASEEVISDAAGGEDLNIYQATENTSFAPVKSTSPAIVPVENGRYTSFFGYRIHPITGNFSFHTGLDIAADMGSKIRAVFGGRVLKTGEDYTAGKYIFLEHDNGLVTFYCHCSEIVAETGAVIRQGETIAKVGSTGMSTGPHLHFEIRKDNIRYNPLYILENDSDC
jgi:murein DD-endopeptidase MepM/ murein hydrolase activator NlpD